MLRVNLISHQNCKFHDYGESIVSYHNQYAQAESVRTSFSHGQILEVTRWGNLLFCGKEGFWSI